MMVYMIGSEDGNPVKIGISDDPIRRVGQLQNGHPFKLRMVRAWQHDLSAYVERRAHKLLKAYRMRGEWFAVDFETAAVAVDLAIIEVDAEVIPKIQELGDASPVDDNRPSGRGEFWPEQLARIIRIEEINAQLGRPMTRHEIIRRELDGEFGPGYQQARIRQGWDKRLEISR